MRNLHNILEGLLDNDFGENLDWTMLQTKLLDGGSSGAELNDAFKVVVGSAKGSKVVKRVTGKGVYAIFWYDENWGLTVVNMDSNECMTWYDFEEPGNIAFGPADDHIAGYVVDYYNRMGADIMYKITPQTWKELEKIFQECSW